MMIARLVTLGVIVMLAQVTAFAAFADEACERRIEATKMYFLPSDPRAVCGGTSVEVQDCMVDLLTKGKGKLRNSDFAEVYAFCLVDPSPLMRTCFSQSLTKAFNDPAYEPARAVASKCLKSRKNLGKSKAKIKLKK